MHDITEAVKARRVKARLKPSTSTCHMCYEMAMSCNAIPPCEDCYDTVDIISTGSNFWGSYAIIARNGRLEEVGLHRLSILEDEQ